MTSCVSVVLSALILGVAGVALFACSSSSSTPPPSANDYAGSCALFSSRCHPIQTALGKECHSLGHDGDDSKCGPRKAECLAECPERAAEPNDAGGTSSPPDGGGTEEAGFADAGSVCSAYCACFTETCALDAGSSSPYADEAACLAACNAFETAARTCVVAACEKAKTVADKRHDCEHASSPTTCH